MQRFASSVRHALNGHLPYQRYYAAGVERKRDGLGEGVLEHLIDEELLIDLNPITQMAKNIQQTTRLIWGFNAYNQAVNLGVRSKAQGQPAAPRPALMLAQRHQSVEQDDPALCQHGTYFLLANLLRQVEQNARRQAMPEIARLSGIARHLGLESSIVYEVSLVLEAEANLQIAELAQRLGCHQRTLERRLRKTGLTAEMLKQANRLLRATARMRSKASLTEIAMETGFSDHAHMTRAFKTSCGMPPSFFQQLLAPPPRQPI